MKDIVGGIKKRISIRLRLVMIDDVKLTPNRRLGTFPWFEVNKILYPFVSLNESSDYISGSLLLIINKP